MTTLHEAAQQALEFVTSKLWGTVPYMDSTVYEDASKLEKSLRSALAQQGEQQPVAWKVVTWNSKTTKSFLTKPEAMDYLTMNDADGDWHIEPVNPAPKEQKNAMELKQAFYDWYDALPDGEPTYQMTFEAGYKAALYAGAAPAAQPDARKVIEQMVDALKKARSFEEGGTALARVALAAGQKLLKELK